MAKETASAEVAEVTHAGPVVAGMSRRQDAVAAVTTLAELTAKLGQEAVKWEDIEPSFTVESKETFEGVPIVVAAFRMNESNKFMQRDEVNPDVLNPGRFVSLLVAPFDENSGDLIGPWVIVNDGGTGICKSLIKMVNVIEADADATRESFNRVAATIPPIIANGGFRRSDYPYEDEKGNISEATTWYLAASPA